MSVPYKQPGLSLASGLPNDPALVRALQRDLRALGYLRSGIDGAFGSGTTRAVQALQYDLLHNDGESTGDDGRAPVSVMSFNDDGQGGQVVGDIDGVVDAALAGCIEAMLGDARVPQLPSSDDPVAENKAALAAITTASSTTAPSPFIAAMVVQESSGRHFNVPRAGDSDTFVIVGLDRNDEASADHITSRGYGIGQYTIFHHPPRPQELQDAIVDPLRNVQKAYAELRDKFDHFVAGPASRADDRTAEHPQLPLRVCKYPPSDQRYLRNCRNCAVAARKVNIVRGTPVYAGASISYQPSQYYPSANYAGVPDRADFPCDWPYAVRRYNGSGNNSFHYQIRVLLNLLAQPPLAGS
jgi:peptidoglycan hydrolase-like protein with peptidoglycan-binding domain